MYIFHPEFHVSVVAHSSAESSVLVRARSYRDLLALIRPLGHMHRYDYYKERIEHTPNYDYPFRVCMYRVDFETAVVFYLIGIEYTSVKDAATSERHYLLLTQVYTLTKRIYSYAKKKISRQADREKTLHPRLRS